jgi:hypothetical protein
MNIYFLISLGWELDDYFAGLVALLDIIYACTVHLIRPKLLNHKHSITAIKIHYQRIEL